MEPPGQTTQIKPAEEVGGIGAWNDYNATSNAAREALLDLDAYLNRVIQEYYQTSLFRE